ncbi:MAG: glycoside hydrolase family 2 protein, partial [Firmicutes bacterium]|nr:glycoside hydrolase family 2 protein [Bacillota bacterium]
MRNILNLNFRWSFSKQAEAVPAEMPTMWDVISLPHSWNAVDGQDGGNDYYRGTAYYAKTFHKMDIPEAKKYFLEIRGANSSATVYLNGQELATHHGGYSTWRVDLTEAMSDMENLLVIAVNNEENDFVYPQMADFTFYGGL